MSNDPTEPPDPPTDLSLSRSDSLSDPRRLEELVQNIARGISACTTSSLAVKTLVDQYLNHAVAIIREDLLFTDERQFKRIDELTRAVQSITLGNQQALGAMQELTNVFRTDATIERGLVSQAREGLEQTTARLERTLQQLVLERKEAQETAPSEDKLPKSLRELWVAFGELGWKHKGRIIGVVLLGTLGWLKATPSIIEAIKMFAGKD